MYKKCKVVMLPTNQKATKGNIVMDMESIRRELCVDEPKDLYWYSRYKPQHLYILSDDEIKPRNWYLWKDKVFQLSDECFLEKEDKCIKIIVSTDTSLGLPSPSQSFIEKYVSEYNLGNIITDVLVEYYISNEILYEGKPVFPMAESMAEYKPKINPKDNTITIKKVKDSWTREEVENILTDYCSYVRANINFHNAKNIHYADLERWIENNL